MAQILQLAGSILFNFVFQSGQSSIQKPAECFSYNKLIDSQGV
jgi:hypothetical protein